MGQLLVCYHVLLVKFLGYFVDSLSGMEMGGVDALRINGKLRFTLF